MEGVVDCAAAGKERERERGWEREGGGGRGEREREREVNILLVASATKLKAVFSLTCLLCWFEWVKYGHHAGCQWIGLALFCM